MLTVVLLCGIVAIIYVAAKEEAMERKKPPGLSQGIVVKCSSCGEYVGKEIDGEDTRKTIMWHDGSHKCVDCILREHEAHDTKEIE